MILDTDFCPCNLVSYTSFERDVTNFHFIVFWLVDWLHHHTCERCTVQYVWSIRDISCSGSWIFDSNRNIKWWVVIFRFYRDFILSRTFLIITFIHLTTSMFLCTCIHLFSFYLFVYLSNFSHFILFCFISLPYMPFTPLFYFISQNGTLSSFALLLSIHSILFSSIPSNNVLIFFFKVSVPKKMEHRGRKYRSPFSPPHSQP